MKLMYLVSQMSLSVSFHQKKFESVLADNRGKVRNILSQAPNFSAFMNQTATSDDTTKISAQMKVAILQFLATSTLVDVRDRIEPVFF